MSMLKKAVLSTTIATSFLLGGCATIPNSAKDQVLNEKVTSKATSDWNLTPAVSYQHIGTDSFMLMKPRPIPKSILDQKIDISMPMGSTLRDYANILATKGVTMVISNDSLKSDSDGSFVKIGSLKPTSGGGSSLGTTTSNSNGTTNGTTNTTTTNTTNNTNTTNTTGTSTSSTSSTGSGSVGNEGGVTTGGKWKSETKLADETVAIPSFKGTIGGLLDALSDTMGCSFEWRNGYILVSRSNDYLIHVPQDQSLMERISSAVQSLGANSVSPSIDTGTIAISVPQPRAPYVEDYLKRISKNNGMIGLQVAVVNVSLDRETNKGMDWSALQAVVGNGVSSALNAAATAATAATDPAAAATTAATTATTTATTTSMLGKYGLLGVDNPAAVSVGNNAMNIALGGGDFHMQALINFLSTYGKTTTNQNLILRTLSGNQVFINSGRKTPYVSGVSLSSTSSTTASTALSGTQTATANTGLNFKITPTYDASTGLITMNMKLDVSSIIKFIDLSAGNQIGSLSQPDIQTQSFNDVARIKAGQTIVLGGLIYNQNSDNRNTVAGAENLPIAGKHSKSTKTAMFIVIRPTVTLYAK